MSRPLDDARRYYNDLLAELSDEIATLHSEKRQLEAENEALRELLIQQEMVWCGYTRQVAEAAIDALLTEESE